MVENLASACTEKVVGAVRSLVRGVGKSRGRSGCAAYRAYPECATLSRCMRRADDWQAAAPGQPACPSGVLSAAADGDARTRVETAGPGRTA